MKCVANIRYGAENCVGKHEVGLRGIGTRFTRQRAILRASSSTRRYRPPPRDPAVGMDEDTGVAVDVQALLEAQAVSVYRTASKLVDIAGCVGKE